MPRIRVLVIATTFPRWKQDSTPPFVFELENRLGRKYGITVLAPHHQGAAKKERTGTLDVRRFAYFWPESLQKLCYGGGIIPNMKKSILARVQLPFLVFTEFLSAKRLIKKGKFDIIHLHWVLPQGIVGVFLNQGIVRGFLNIVVGLSLKLPPEKPPLIVTIHGSDLFPIKNWFLRRIQHNTTKHVDLITVNSEATRQELLRRFPEVAEKTRIIPMGVDTSLFKQRRLRKPAEFKGKKILLFVGRLSDQKGLQYLVRAMPSILRKQNNALLLIIGDGPYRQELDNLIIKNRVGHAVRFPGALPQDKVAFYHNICDVFVLPALSNETGTEALGLALLEAMASGCAVVGTTVGGIPSAITHGKTGMLVNQKDSQELASAIISLLKNQKKSADVGRNASIFIAKNYSWESVVKRFDQAYNGVVP